MTPTNIYFTPKKYAGAVGLDRCPSQCDMEVRRTPDLKLIFVGFIRFVGFNFGHGQLLRFVIVMVQSYSISNFDLVK